MEVVNLTNIISVGVFFPLGNTLSRRYGIANNLNYHPNDCINAVSNRMIFPQGLSVKLPITLMFWYIISVLRFSLFVIIDIIIINPSVSQPTQQIF